jgi:biopolymer transport protein ExbB
MKRIAISLGSLSLAVMSGGSCEALSPQKHLPSLATDAITVENLAQLTQQPGSFTVDDLSSLELEKELLSLEKELEEEQALESLHGGSVALKEIDTHKITSKTENINQLVDESDSIMQEASLEGLLDPNISLDLQKNLLSPLDTEINKQISLNHNFHKSNIANLDTENDELEETDVEPPAEQSDEKVLEISLNQVFSGSPTIYLALFGLSCAALSLWLYNAVTLKQRASTDLNFIKAIKANLSSSSYDDVLTMCSEKDTVFSKMLSSAVTSRCYGLQFMLETMKTEGKRASISFWQRLNLIHDIAVIAPMLGLLGTVLGMFYAFYDLNRSFESITSLFDGLGVSVGTTVAGIFVAILAMVLHSTSKYRLIKSLTYVENEAVSLARLIDNNANK